VKEAAINDLQRTRPVECLFCVYPYNLETDAIVADAIRKRLAYASFVDVP
jgi:hypothetical protein